MRTLVPLGLVSSLLALGCGGGTKPTGFATLLVEPASLNLPPTAVGLVSTATVTVRSSASAPFTVQVTAGADADPAFTVIGVPAELAADGTLRFQVRFAPPSTGARAVTLRVSGNADGVRPVDLPVRGLGVGSPSLRVEPSTFDFGPTVVGDRRVRTMRLENPGDELVVVTLGLMGASACDAASPSRFCLDAGNRLREGTITLAAGEQLTVSWAYRPTGDRGTDEARISLRTCAGTRCDGGTQAVTLLGRSARGSFVCTPDTIAFRSVGQGDCAQGGVSCRNVAQVPLALVAASVAPAGDFRLDPATLPRTLQPDETLELGLRFCPALPGRQVGTLVLENEERANGEGRNVVNLSGEGTGVSLFAEPAALDFGRVATGVPARRALKLFNRGAEPIVLTGLELPPEVVLLERVPMVLAPGEILEFTVEFNSSSLGPFREQLGFNTDARGQAQFGVPVRAEVELLGPCEYQLRPESLEFGALAPGLPRRRGFVIENPGTIACVLTSARLLPGASAELRLRALAPGTEIPPGGELIVEVEVEPMRSGSISGLVELGLSSPARPFSTVAVRAEVQEPALTVSPSELDFGSLEPGCRGSAQTLSLVNDGTAEVEVREVTLVDPLSGFTVQGAPSFSLVPGQSADLQLEFSGTQPGTYLAAVELRVAVGGVEQRLVVPLRSRVEAGAEVTETFQQGGVGPVDLLWVVDSTPSPREADLIRAGNVAAFLDYARGAAIDFNLGVITSDLQPGSAGVLRPLANERPRVVRATTTPSPETAFVLNANPPSRPVNSVEQGLEAARRSLSRALLSNQNSGFLREDALLTLVFVANEDDFSSPQPWPSYLRLFQSVKPRPQAFQAIGLLAIPDCVQSQSSFYGEVALASGGVVVSLCQQDWEPVLRSLAGRLFGVRPTFPLRYVPADGAAHVFVDGVEQPRLNGSGVGAWRVAPDSNLLEFTPAAQPPPGSEVRVKYTQSCR